MDFLSTTDVAQAAYVSVHGYPPDEIEPVDEHHSRFSWHNRKEVEDLLANWEYSSPADKRYYIAYRRLITSAMQRQREEFGGGRNA